MRGLRVICLCAVVSIAALSCKNNSVGPIDGGATGFSVKITVINSSNSPVQGLQVSVANSMSPLPLAGLPVQKRGPAGVTANSAITWEAPVRARVNVTVFDMDGSTVLTLASGNLPAGAFRALFSPLRSFGTRAFKCRLIASDTASGAPLFRDSIYAVLWNNDASLGVIGSTSAAGMFETRDSLLFPNVFALPPLVLTNSTGPAPLGTFYIPDTINVTLSDTLAKKSQTYPCVVQPGVNDIHLVWNPPAGTQAVNAGPRAIEGPVLRAIRTHSDADLPPTVWRLWQNYPNPFN